MRRILILTIATFAAAAAQAPAQSPGVLAELPNESEVTALGALAVVSVYDAQARGYRLTLVQPGKPPQPLPVAASPVPFDADLGPAADGRAAVVYSRCANPRARPEGDCDLAMYVLGDAAEQPVASASSPEASDYEPSLWRGRLAWVRAYPDGREIAYTRSLSAKGPSRREPGLPTRNCEVLVDPGDCTTRERHVTDLKLAGDRLAYIGGYTVRRQAGFATQEVRLVDLRTQRSRRVALSIAGEGGQGYLGLSFAAGRLGWQRSCFGDPGGCIGRGAFRYRYAKDSYEFEPRYRSLTGFALLDDGALGLDGRGELGDDPGDPKSPPCDDLRTEAKELTCPLIGFQPAWKPIVARRVR